MVEVSRKGDCSSMLQASPTRPQLNIAKVVLQCPACGSSLLRKSGWASRADRSKVQRYRCLDCNLRFRPEREEANTLKGMSAIQEIAEYATLEVSKNLVSAEDKSNFAAAGVTLPSSDPKSEILAYSWKMQKEGYGLETIRCNTGSLKALLARNADLDDPETVKEALAREQVWSSCRRRNVINAYTLYLKFHGLKWDPPRCNVTKKIPFIPTEQEIDDLIAGCPVMIAALLQLLKETAMRSGEAKRLKWIDVDLERHVITLNEPEKGSNTRIFNNLSSRLLGMLNGLPRTSSHVFGERSLNSMKAVYIRSRRKIAFKLANPRLKVIHFHTLRHWKATMEYHYTKDILHVQEFLGHKNIDNTLIYISLDKNLFANLPDDSFIIRAAHSLDEAVKLGEVGFEPFVVMEGVQLFRKRK